MYISFCEVKHLFYMFISLEHFNDHNILCILLSSLENISVVIAVHKSSKMLH